MGKPDEPRLGIREDLADGDTGLLRACCAIGRFVTPRCVAVLLLSVCLLVSAVFWLPPLNFLHHTHGGADADDLSAEIQASFILPKPKSMLSAYTERLEYDIFEEIGVPNSKVCIISMHPLAHANSTYVVFGVLPDSKTARISSPVLSLLRSSFIELVLEQLNLSLTPSIFGHASSFEILRFPGGITVIPVQSASIWERTQTLFHFRLNNSIFQIQKNLDELKNQLKLGLHLRPYENVYVQMANDNGSTAAPPVTVEASVLSDVGSQILLPDRLKQLAQLITGSHAENLGLNHSVFGRVKQVQLSSYLEHSISSGESPTPSPFPSPSSPSPSPSPFPSPYPTPSLSPSPSPAPFPIPSPSPSPSPSPFRYPYPRIPSHPHGVSPARQPFPHSPTTPDASPGPTRDPALSPGPSYSPSPSQGEPPMSASPPNIPSQSSQIGPHLYAGIWSFLLIVLVFRQLHESD